MVRILHAVPTDLFAGVERFVVELANSQVRAGDQVVVAGGEPAAMRAGLDRRIGHRRVRSTAALALLLARSRGQFDIVNVHMTAAELAATGAGPVLATPVVATCHFAHPRGAGSGRARPVVARVAEAGLAAQIAVSRHVAQMVGDCATVVYSGVPERAMAAKEREPVVLVAQRLEPEKLADDALAIFAASGVRERGWRLHVAGTGSRRDALQEYAVALGIADVTSFLGQRRDVEALMDRAAVLVAPTRVEGLGLTVLEAMAGGLPVLAARAGGHLETVGIVPGGRLYDDVDDGAAQLAQLASDDLGRAAYGQALQSTQRERFTLAAQYAGTDAVYRRAMARHR